MGIGIGIGLGLSKLRYALIALRDSDISVNEVEDDASNGSSTGLTAFLRGTDETVTYSIVSQTISGAFEINSSTGAVTVLDNTKLTTL